MLRSPVPMVLLWGEDGIMIYNDAYSSFAGSRHPDLLGSKVREGWREIADFNDNVMKVGLSGGTLSLKNQELVLDRNGIATAVWMDLDYSPVIDESGDPAGVIAIVVETTEKFLADRRVAAERDHLWTLSEDMLARAGYDGSMSAANPAWTTVLGYSVEHILSHPYADIIHPDDVGTTVTALTSMQQTGHPTRFENRIRASNGEWTPIGWTVSPEPRSDYFIAVGRDLSDYKARERELEEAQEALRQSRKLDAMGQLTGGVAHDFNNLLTPILGSLDLLKRLGLGSAREQRLIDGALQSAERARTLVQRLLAFARRQPLQAVPVDLANLLNGMVTLLGSTIGPQVKVRLTIADELPPAIADANQIEMAVLNLAVNSRDAMPSGGTLTISADRESVGAGHRTQLPRGHYVRIAVVDTGIGMNEETLNRAVEPFFSTKGIGKGTGLGLSMVHGLALQLNGAVTIKSEPGRGTTVEIWLPISSYPIKNIEDTAGDRQELATVGTALLVDDEDVVRVSTADMLTELGFTVIESRSAEEAIQILDRGVGFDLLITDHLMPGMTGAELADVIKARRPDTPVLIVSGYAEIDGVARDLPRLMKPFRQSDLIKTLNGLTFVNR